MTADPSLGYDPVNVRIVGSDVPLRSSSTGRKRRSMTSRSYLLTSNDPAQTILPESDSRVEAWIASIIAEQEVQMANPAAASNAVYTVTQVCQLMSATFTGVTSATVANRQGLIMVKDAAGNIIYQAMGASSETASQTVTYSFAQGYGGGGAILSGNDTSGLPSIVLQPGWTITIGLSNIQAGDQISAVNLLLASTASCVIGKTKGDVTAGGNSAAIIQAAGTPFPLNTTDQVWAGAAFTPTTISVVAFYEQPD